MSAILGSLLQNLIKCLFFIAVAWAGITCGKKYRDHKDAKSALEPAEKKDTK